MPNILTAVQSPADVRQNVQTFNIEAAQFYDRAARLLRETTYWVYDPATESFGPSKFVGFTEMSFDRTPAPLPGIPKARDSTARSRRRRFQQRWGRGAVRAGCLRGR